MGLAPVTSRLLRTAAIAAVALGLGAMTVGRLGTIKRPDAAFALIPVSERIPLEDFDFEDDRGQVHHIKDIIGPHPLLIHYWATWCGPCGPELPGLNALAASQAGQLQIVPLALDRNPFPKVPDYLAEKHLTALAALAPAANAPLPQALPASMLVDTGGRIAWKSIGAHPWDGPDIIHVIDELKN